MTEPKDTVLAEDEGGNEDSLIHTQEKMEEAVEEAVEEAESE